MNPLALPNTDFTLAHSLLRQRWPVLVTELLRRTPPLPLRVIEVFRSDRRQAWLYGQGRTVAQLRAVDLDPGFARPGPIVTNAYSAALSAHGWRLADGTPASCALDVVPVGADGQPWTRDDPWEEFVAAVRAVGDKIGLRHFSKPGKPPWDKPHLQLVEWNDRLHRLVLPV